MTESIPAVGPGCVRQGHPSPGDSSVEGPPSWRGESSARGSIQKTFSFRDFPEQTGCKTWRENGFRDYLLLFKEKSLNFA